jgi:hypothetical protein
MNNGISFTGTLTTTTEVWLNGRKFIPALNVKHEHLLTTYQWELLEIAEKPLYTGDPGCHAYTDVMSRDDGGLAADIWEQCRWGIEAMHPDHATDSTFVQQMIARRVARALALMSFGEEFLLR